MSLNHEELILCESCKKVANVHLSLLERNDGVEREGHDRSAPRKGRAGGIPMECDCA